MIRAGWFYESIFVVRRSYPRNKFVSEVIENVCLSSPSLHYWFPR